MRPKSSLPPAKKPLAPVRGTATHEIRIIGGQWRRTPIKVLDKPGLRPTPDRVRETLFNWLGQDLSGWRCVDAFAGTGALGLEAASRGAAQVMALESDAELTKHLQALAERLKTAAVQVQRGSLFPAACISLYTMYLAYSALQAGLGGVGWVSRWGACFGQLMAANNSGCLN